VYRFGGGGGACYLPAAAAARRSASLGGGGAGGAARRVGTALNQNTIHHKMTKLLQFSGVHFSICLFYYL